MFVITYYRLQKKKVMLQLDIRVNLFSMNIKYRKIFNVIFKITGIRFN